MHDRKTCTHELMFDCLVFVIEQDKGLEEQLVSSRHTCVALDFYAQLGIACFLLS
jgi:hypothetical protein